MNFVPPKLQQGFSERDPDALYFLPLGGSGEIGMNLNLYGHDGKWPNAVGVRTRVGAVLRTAAWKLDPDPLIGPPTAEGRLRQVGDGGALAIVCDSTNALRPGSSRSEGELRQSLTELIGCYDGRVAV